MYCIRIPFQAATHASFADMLRDSGLASPSALIKQAAIAYYYATARDPDLRGAFAAINRKQQTYELTPSDVPDSGPVHEIAELNVDDFIIDDIGRSFAAHRRDDIIARSLHLYGRLLDTRTRGFDGAGLIDGGKIAATVMGLPHKLT